MKATFGLVSIWIKVQQRNIDIRFSWSDLQNLIRSTHSCTKTSSNVTDFRLLNNVLTIVSSAKTNSLNVWLIANIQVLRLYDFHQKNQSYIDSRFRIAFLYKEVIEESFFEGFLIANRPDLAILFYFFK